MPDSRGVLVVCDVTDGPAGEIAQSVDVADHVEVIEVRHTAEIAGAVLEALAFDVPLVLDVRLSRDEGEMLCRSGVLPTSPQT